VTIFRAIDLETTGFKEEDGPQQGIMEIGYTDLIEGQPIGYSAGFLVDCGIPCSIEARAVHHISDEMCAGEMKPDEACMTLARGEHAYYCAHNIDFEKKFFGGGEKQWICTYKTSARLWVEAPGHKLHELRYFLNLDAEPDFNRKLTEPPHRAPPDSYVCAHLLRRVLLEAEKQNVSLERLVKWSAGPALVYMCFMPKHKGKPWSTVAHEDRPYLVWIYDKSDITNRDVRATVKYWLNQTAKTPQEKR
jgi:exodeoxyribonuclease X